MVEIKSKRKGFKYISKYILLFLFVCGGALMGVALALSFVDVPIGGKIIFNASDIYAQVTGTVTGSKTENTLDVLRFEWDSPAFTTPSSWSNMKFDFAENTPIELTITINNLSNEREIWVTFVENIKADNVSTTRSVDGTTVSAFTNQVISKSGTKVIKLIWQVENPDEEVTNGSFNLDITLTSERVAVDESVYADTMSFTSFNTSAKTCAVTSAGDTTITTLDIPASILHNGVEYAVTTIANNAFQNCANLTKVTISEGLTTIGTNAFDGCSMLENVKLPSTLKSLGGWAFKLCTSLKTIDLSQTAITGDFQFRIFESCSALEEALLPSGITGIGGDAFTDCTALKKISIPAGVKTISAWVFKNCSSLESVDFNEGLQTLGEGAFSGCLKLTSIELPASVTKLNRRVFNGCNNLTSVKFYDLGTWNGVHYSDTSKTFSDLKITDLAQNAKNLVQEALYRDYIWTRTAPKDTDYAGLTFTYNNTTKTASVKGADTTQTSIVIPYDITCNQTSTGGGTIGETYTVTEIGGSAFNNYSALTSVTIPAGVTKIGSNAFQYSKITSVIFNGTSSLTSIGAAAFSSCANLTSIIIPASVTSIGASAFQNCTKLASVTFAKNSSLTTIGSSAFAGCKPALTSIELPDSVTTISSFAFNSCQNLTEIRVPSKVTKLEAWTFNSCIRLKKIYIPASVTSIADTAFASSSAIEEIIVESGNTAYYVENGCLIKKSNMELVHGCYNSTIPSGVKIIDGYAFAGSTKAITIPASVTQIRDRAFQDLKQLTSITVESGNTAYYVENGCLIENSTKKLIAGCNIANISIPSGVTSIATSAFLGRSGLTTLTIPSSVTSIGANAFNGCSLTNGVTFETPTGWSAGTTTISEDLSIASTAATCLKTTYVSSAWTRS